MRNVTSPMVASVLAGALVLAASPMAHAQTKPAKPAAAAHKADTAAASASTGVPSARTLYGSGEKKYKAGDYAGALVDFQAADSIKPAPQAARYIGLCQDKLGHLTDAVTSYERFLLNVPAKLAKEGEEIKKRVDEIKAMPGKLHVETAPAGALVSIDGKPQAQATPLDADLPPGKHTLHVTADGKEAQDRDVDIPYASKQEISLQLVDKAPAVLPSALAATPVTTTPPPDTTPPPAPVVVESRSKVPAYVTGGLAIVAAGVGTVFGVMALGDKSDFDKNPTSSTADNGENHALIADMAFGVAITLGVTSAVLFLTHDDSNTKVGQNDPRIVASAPAKKRSFTITPSPIVTPHGGGAGALIRF